MPPSTTESDAPTGIDRFFSRLGYTLLSICLALITFLGTWITIDIAEGFTASLLAANPLLVVLIWVALVIAMFIVIIFPFVFFEDAIDGRRGNLPRAISWAGAGTFVAFVLTLIWSVPALLGFDGLAQLFPAPGSSNPHSTLLTAIPVGVMAWLVHEAEFDDDEDADHELDPDEVRRRTVRTTQSNRNIHTPTGRTPTGTPSSAPSDGPTSQPERSSQNGSERKPSQNTDNETETDDSETDDDDGADLEYDWEFETNVSLNDVGGMKELKAELQRELIRPLTTDRERAEELGIPTPNILFYGPPGTGKTFIAKALATELGLPFARLSGADIQSKWINESAGRVKKLFDEAKQLAAEEGGAIIFLDELDAVLPDRSGHTHEENRKVVNEFLAHLQETSEHDVVFIGATNRRADLDAAATRRGRIDREIEIGLPDHDSRKAILQAQLRNRKHDLSGRDFDVIAHNTSGFSAAELEGLVVDAARNAAFKRDDGVISLIDLQAAYEKIDD